MGDSGMTCLHTILYVSTASPPMTCAALGALLSVARENNQACGITGLLVYNEGTFMQCVEGPSEPLLQTFGRIQASRLHKNVLEVVNEPIGERTFPRWDMAFIGTGEAAVLSLASDEWVRLCDEQQARPEQSHTFSLLRAFLDKVRI